ncbi:MAG TPA: HD domain-containing protein [Longimicrobiaceae bacterium]|nr:HD domain-containing protein [Longimicrobiaceae bacterium]
MSGAVRRLNGALRPDLRTFCGAAFPWPLVTELADGREVTACFLVHDKQRKETKHAKPYLTLVLGDRTGTIEAKVWDDADRLEREFVPDDVVGVRARVSTYNDRLQLTVLTAQSLAITDDDLELFLPASPRDRGQMGRELDALVDSIGDLALRTLVQRCVGRKTGLGRQYRIHPAAKRNHHAYLGGLMEHSISVARSCDRLAAHYAEQGARLDRDVLIAGALLHDLGKVRELTARRTFGYTDEGQLLGHILIGLQIVGQEAEAVPGIEPGTLLHLQHLIASHQGRHEWASPKVPQTLEAVILHYADDLDSKMNPAIASLAGVDEGGWSAYDRNMERALFRAPGLPRSGDVEAVAPAEVATVLIDLFRG